MYLWWSLCPLYFLAYQLRVTVGDSDLCCCVCVTSIERYNELPCVLILHERSGPRSVSDCVIAGYVGGKLLLKKKKKNAGRSTKRLNKSYYINSENGYKYAQKD